MDGRNVADARDHSPRLDNSLALKSDGKNRRENSIESVEKLCWKKGKFESRRNESRIESRATSKVVPLANLSLDGREPHGAAARLLSPKLQVRERKFLTSRESIVLLALSFDRKALADSDAIGSLSKKRSLCPVKYFNNLATARGDGRL